MKLDSKEDIEAIQANIDAAKKTYNEASKKITAMHYDSNDIAKMKSITDEKLRQQRLADPKDSDNYVVHALLGILGMVILIFIIFFFIKGSCFGGNNTVKDVSDGSTAAIMCRRYVERRLVSPSTAKFCVFYHSDITYLSNGKYIVDSCVDAQNKFGAIVRVPFMCTVTYDGSLWRLNHLSMQD